MPGRMEARDLGSGVQRDCGWGAAGIHRFLLIIIIVANLHQFYTISSHVIHKGTIEYILILNLKKIMERT